MIVCGPRSPRELARRCVASCRPSDMDLDARVTVDSRDLEHLASIEAMTPPTAVDPVNVKDCFEQHDLKRLVVPDIGPSRVERSR